MNNIKKNISNVTNCEISTIVLRDTLFAARERDPSLKEKIDSITKYSVQKCNYSSKQLDFIAAIFQWDWNLRIQSIHKKMLTTNGNIDTHINIKRLTSECRAILCNTAIQSLREILTTDEFSNLFYNELSVFHGVNDALFNEEVDRIDRQYQHDIRNLKLKYYSI